MLIIMLFIITFSDNYFVFGSKYHNYLKAINLKQKSEISDEVCFQNYSTFRLNIKTELGVTFSASMLTG